MNCAWCRSKQAGKIAHNDLVQHLAAAGCHKAGLAEGCLKHETRDVSFTLVIDDLLIERTQDDDLDHPITAM